jgi:NAD(P)-dependent dehydrogenase (short-subunit alcohol dehydrogenase family)
MSLHRKVILVTGAGQGIGKGIARTMLEAGASVLLAELDEQAGQQTADEYAQLGPVSFVRTDVADESSVAAAIAQAIATFGQLDGLVNNAGIADPDAGPIEALTLERWNRVIATNLTGMFLCSKHATAELRKRRGAIVNIASTRALQSEPNTAAYSAAKGGVVALTHALAISLGPEVRVNCVSPGWIDVATWKKAGQRGANSLRPQDHAQHPVGRVGQPEDVARLVRFLLDDEAGFITAQNFVVDGGMTRKMIYQE